MKAFNYKERRQGLLKFSIVFGILIMIMFLNGYITLKTGALGISVLEEKHALYSKSFRTKAALNFDVEEIIKKLFQINNKDRNLAQHKKFQDLISNIRDKVSEIIKAEKNADEFIIYEKLIKIIKDTQSDLDTYEEESEKHFYIDELLERCKEKYIEEQVKKNKQKWR